MTSDLERLPGSSTALWGAAPGGTGLFPSALQVKQIMEEAVTRKFVHEDSSHIISFCGESVARPWPGKRFLFLGAASGKARLRARILASQFAL